jgi:dsRNA-specific ribonuclease
MFDGLYEKYKQLPMKELCAIMASYTDEGSKANIARLVYEERQMEQKYKYEKEQIKLQHENNRSLLIEQLKVQKELINIQIKAQTKWMKFSIIGVLFASLIGAIVGAILQPVVSWQLIRPPQSNQEKMTAPKPQQQPLFSTTGRLSGKESNSSFQPTNKDERH